MQLLPSPARLPTGHVRLPSPHVPSLATLSPRLTITAVAGRPAMDANAGDHLRSSFVRVLRSRRAPEGDRKLLPLTLLVYCGGLCLKPCRLTFGSGVDGGAGDAGRLSDVSRWCSLSRGVFFNEQQSLILIVWGGKLVP